MDALELQVKQMKQLMENMAGVLGARIPEQAAPTTPLQTAPAPCTPLQASSTEHAGAAPLTTTAAMASLHLNTAVYAVSPLEGNHQQLKPS